MTDPITSLGGAQQLPASIQKADSKTQQAYETAVSFENMLIQELSQSMTQAAQGSDDGSTSDPSASMLTGMMPQALAQSLTGGTTGVSPLTSELMTDFNAKPGQAS